MLSEVKNTSNEVSPVEVALDANGIPEITSLVINRTLPDVYVWIYEENPVTSCDNPNGAAFAFAYTATEDGSAPPATDANPPADTLLSSDGYEVFWRVSSDAINTLIATGNLLENVEAQTYTADITDNATGCKGTENINITSTLAPIQGLAIEVVDITVCGGTGNVSANVNGNTTDYTFEWYNGANVTPSPDATGDTYSVDEAGPYTVVAIEIATGCTSQPETIEVVEDFELPNIGTPTVSANTSCSASVPTGIIDVSTAVTPATEDYYFNLYSGTTTAGTQVGSVDDETGIFTDLAAGQYTITARNQNTGCESAAITVIIDDTPDYPIINIAPTMDDSCIDGNGTIRVTSSSTVTEPSSYTYELYDGFSDDPTDLITALTVAAGGSHTFNDLEAGDYRVRVTNNDLGCENFEDLIIYDDSVVPIFSSSFPINDNTSCDPSFSNGSVEVSIDEMDFDPLDYTWSWYEGSTTDESNRIAINENQVTELSSGDYTVFATDNETGCSSTESILTIQDVPNEIVIISSSSTELSGNTTLSAVVDGSNLDAGCTECVGADGFTFEWFFGDGTSNPLDDTDIGGNGTLIFNEDNTVVEGVIAGVYTVSVTENMTACFSTQSIVVVANSAPIADAGVDQTVEADELVTLDGSGSSDPDGDPITYLWSAPDGIELSDNTAMNPTFVAPELAINDDVLLFSLTISDGKEVSEADAVAVTLVAPLGVNEFNKAFYPNPAASGKVYFNNAGLKLESITIFNTSGQLLKTINFTSYETMEEIDVSAFESGIYYIYSENSIAKIIKR